MYYHIYFATTGTNILFGTASGNLNWHLKKKKLFEIAIPTSEKCC